MDNKKVIAGAAGVAIVGILSYLGYRVFKELQNVDVDFVGENLLDEYYYNTRAKSGGK